MGVPLFRVPHISHDRRRPNESIAEQLVRQLLPYGCTFLRVVASWWRRHDLWMALAPGRPAASARHTIQTPTLSSALFSSQQGWRVITGKHRASRTFSPRLLYYLVLIELETLAVDCYYTTLNDPVRDDNVSTSKWYFRHEWPGDVKQISINQQTDSDKYWRPLWPNLSLVIKNIITVLKRNPCMRLRRYIWVFI